MNPLIIQNGRSLDVDTVLFSHTVWCLLVASVLSFSAGCFDAEAMIASRQKIAQISRLEEVDLGAFRVTLPQLPNTTTAATVDFHAFGRVANSDLKRVAQAIEDHSSELRHRMLIAVRELDLSELEEPSLDTLRINIKHVFNETVGGDPLQAVGYYRFALSGQ